MDETCKRNLIFAIFAVQLCRISGQPYTNGIDLTPYDYPDSDSDAASELQKRLSKFVRIGRGLSSFMRIGRQNLNPQGAMYQLEDLSDDDLTDPSDGAFYNFEPTQFESPAEKPIGQFIALDGNYEDNSGSGTESGGVEKRGGAFIRMGKFPTSAFLRNRAGRVNQVSPTKYYRRTGRIGHSSFIRIGKRDTTEALKHIEADENDDNTEQFNNYQEDQDTNESDGGNGPHTRWLKFGRGLSDDDDVVDTTDLINNPDTNFDEANNELEQELDNNKDPEEKRYSSFVRIGKNFAESDNSPNKRYSSFVRIGRDAEKRRISSFVRIGKSPYNPYGSDLDKRLSSFVRIGKGFNQNTDNLDKRYSSFVRIGKNYSPLETDDVNKRYSSFVRIGKSSDDDINKRYSSFVRIGKNSDDDINKRYSSFVRIGKSSDDDVTDDVNKRYSSFVRIGKNNPYNNEEIQKRLSAFMRVGKGDQTNEDDSAFNKRYSSFVRIGKNIAEPYKRYSSFVRIGKDVGNDVDKRLSAFMRVGKDTIADNLSNNENSSDLTDLPSYYADEQEHVIEKRASDKENMSM